MSDSYEDMRRKELEVQEKQLFAQRVTAAASVANAVAAHKQAVAVEEMRVQMAVNAAREAEHQREMAAQQRQMAEEQRLTNFRNTVLTTLPLLKSEEEKTQFLTEQLLPKLKENVDVKIYGPFELICLWFTAESHMVTAHLKDEAGLDLNNFLSDGNDLMTRVEIFLKKTEDRKKQAEELKKTQARLSEISKPFWKKGLTAFFVTGFVLGGINKLFHGDDDLSPVLALIYLTGWVGVPLLMYLAVKSEIRSLKLKVLALTPKDDGSELVKEGRKLENETELQKEKWESYKPKIIKYITSKFNDQINCDARSLLVENVVTPQLEPSLREVQSFLPPSSRLPAKHFAEFFVGESDVKECAENQLNIKKQLELAIEPFYKNKTVIVILERVRPDLAPKPSDSDLRTVRLTNVPADKKISVIKALRTVKPELGLAEAKELSENAPVVILDSVSPQEAQRAIATLEAAGAMVELT